MNPQSTPSRVYSIALVLAWCAILTSCSSTVHADPEVAPSSQLNRMPNFSGPWAELFRDEYARAPNDEIRGYLSDEVITEAENQAVTEAFRKCMSSRGLTFDGFEFDGSYSFGFAQVSNSDDANEIATECEMSSGADQVSFLYHQMKLNPENRDLAPDIAACLVRAGVVPTEYTAKEYTEYHLWEQTTTDAVSAKEAENACQKDLAGAFRG